MKKIILTLLVFLGTIFFVACSTGNKSGKTIVFNFESNPTTGYDWYYEFASGNDKAELVIDKDDFKAADTSMAGAPGVHIFKFSAKKPGKQSIIFTYKRPWGGGEIAYDVVYELSVDDKLNIKCTNKKKGNVNSDKDLSFFPNPTFE